MDLPKKAKQDYIKSKGMHCPYCRSGNIDAGAFDGEGPTQPVRCLDCGRRWTDTYVLIGIEEEEDQA